MRDLPATKVQRHARPVLGQDVLQPVIRDGGVRAAVHVHYQAIEDLPPLGRRRVLGPACALRRSARAGSLSLTQRRTRRRGRGGGATPTTTAAAVAAGGLPPQHISDAIRGPGPHMPRDDDASPLVKVLGPGADGVGHALAARVARRELAAQLRVARPAPAAHAAALGALVARPDRVPGVERPAVVGVGGTLRGGARRLFVFDMGWRCWWRHGAGGVCDPGEVDGGVERGAEEAE